MILPKLEDALHKVQLYRLLMTILDNRYLARSLYFKGGSCATMLGWLDRFSLDLDFDVDSKVDKKKITANLHSIFKTIGLEIKNQPKGTLLFILRYQTKPGLRNTLKLGVMENTVLANDYQPFYLSEIDRYAICQTRETMVANKLVSLIDRYEKHGTIAGRDVYDIHYFLSHGFAYKKKVIEERRKTDVFSYLKKLREFLKKKVTEKIVTEDLSYLLPYEKFKAIRRTLKTEALFLLDEEIRRKQQSVKQND